MFGLYWVVFGILFVGGSDSGWAFVCECYFVVGRVSWVTYVFFLFFSA